ncbi:MBL fold metallo-hydrolase [Virgibacillus salinus]|uniref:Metal-dependent hydrolase, beta-lactamase superfamily II n=1 Tax=Virgibacillus salinus TaxID=553311 RepID=A0A1H0YWU6_9BACI|nr:MBL fold metallo-hydrolase [Virgibacillus salinus]SDQ19689.1 Metal-dependent hydrolase, beta-lactamase superfamily II [Virgibacillus salinus]
MTKKYLFILIFAILVACGQNTDQGSTDQQKGTNHSESVKDSLQDKEKPKEQDSNQSETDGATKPISDDKPVKKSNSLSDLKVHYIDVGQADATLFQYKSNGEQYTILFDTGDWQGNEVANYLLAQGVSSIDVLIVSHADADHSGQLADVMNTFDVGEVWMSGNESSSQTFQQGMKAVLASDADYDEPRTGDTFEIGTMDITVLHPSSISGNTNEESISAKFTYGDMSFLFTGDADRDSEMEMVNSGNNVNADIVQLGHHGSNTSSSPAFIDAVSPEIAIYSAGADNQYGHPHAEVISLIQNAGIKLYGTDVHGTIVVTTDGKDYTIQTKEDGTISPSNSDSSDNSSNNDTNNQSTSTENKTATRDCININNASSNKLQEIIHIGPARAEDLMKLRPYQSVDDLTDVSGIGPSRIADIKSQGLACTGG